MSLTFSEARNEMVKTLTERWSTLAAAIVGYQPELRVWNIVYRNPEPTSLIWGRLSVQSVDETRTGVSVGNDEGVKKYTASGLIFVQLFAPSAYDDSPTKLENLAVMVKKAYRGKKRLGWLWYRNVKILDLPPLDGQIRFNVVAEYEYDEIG